MQRAVAERRTIINEELDIERADGSRITIYSYAAPAFDASGEVISCVAAQIDITERKQLELKRESPPWGRAGTASRGGRGESPQGRVSGDRIARTANAAELYYGLDLDVSRPLDQRRSTGGAVAAVDRGAKAECGAYPKTSLMFRE